MCQGFSHFLDFLPYFVLAKLATSSIRVNITLDCQKYHICSQHFLRVALSKKGFNAHTSGVYIFPGPHWPVTR